jgi:putative endonuclease
VKKVYHVYILTNISKMLYVGVTGDLHRRMFEHKEKLIPGFSKKYNLHRLVYLESFSDVRHAIDREKEIKGWLRVKKVALIQAVNPQWKDLAEDWFRTSTNPARTLQSSPQSSPPTPHSTPPPTPQTAPPATSSIRQASPTPSTRQGSHSASTRQAGPTPPHSRASVTPPKCHPEGPSFGPEGSQRKDPAKTAREKTVARPNSERSNIGSH